MSQGLVTFLGHARKVKKNDNDHARAEPVSRVAKKISFFAHPFRGLNEFLDPSKATSA